MKRKDFISAAALGGALGATGCGSPAGPGKSAGGDERQRFSSGRLEADVVVVGGGMSGVCAALASARSGASTVLVQSRPVLGGNSSSEIRLPVMGANSSGIPHSRETGLVEELRLENQVRNPGRIPRMWDLILYEKCSRQKGLTLLLNTVMRGVRSDSGRVRSIGCYRLRTEEHLEIEGGVFIDCTGDGTLGALAGNPFRVGQEARSEFGESMAPEQALPHVLSPSLLFEARDTGTPAPFRRPHWAHTYPDDESIGRGHGDFRRGYWWLAWGGMKDVIGDDDLIREELLRILFGIWDHIKNRGDHGAENWALDWFGVIPGRRESRRLEGAYIMRQDDVTSGRVFDDEVAFGGWGVDHHDPRGFDYKGRDFFFHPKLDRLYSIPLRSLYSTALCNLFFAGRNISASHLAFCSNRVMATCAVIGQAAGTAAAWCAARGKATMELSADDTGAIKQALLRDDAFLVGTPNSDPDDFARGATVRAGSEMPGHEARLVVDGWSRPVGDKPHHWCSKSPGPEKAWIELDFGEARKIGSLHLSFDTGLSRLLTMTRSDSLYEQMEPGPQPETVRDYRVEVLDGGSWRTVVEERGNYRRKRVHSLGGLPCERVRIRVDATNGVPEARIMEVRCYA